MKAYLIARVSTLEQSDAIGGQVYRLKAYAERKGYIYELFEILESAYKSERASFKQVIENVTSTNEPCVIVFDKIDRYTRNSNSKEVSLLNTLCRSGQIEIHFPSDNLFISARSSAQEHFMLNMGVSTAQYYSDAISDNVKRRNQQKWRDGEWCGKAPIGYLNTKTPEGKKWVEPDPYTAKIVREAFELYASGNYSLRSIANKWREEYGLKNTHSSRIEQVLKNPFYYGEMRVLEKIYPHSYTPIITRSLFEQAKSVREGFKIAPRKWGALMFAYRGMIRCADCGCIVTFETKKGKYTYGHCTRKKNKHPLKYVSEEKLTKQVMTILEQVQIPSDKFDELSAAFKKRRDTKLLSVDKRRRVIDAEIKKYEDRKERVYEDYLDGKIHEDFYTRKFNEFDTSLKLRLEEKEGLELSDDRYYSSISYLLLLAKNLVFLFSRAEKEQQRSILDLIVSNLELDGELLRWKYKKPFETMALCTQNANWLRLLGSNQRPNRYLKLIYFRIDMDYLIIHMGCRALMDKYCWAHVLVSEPSEVF